MYLNLPKPLKWQSFYRHDLDLSVATPQDIRDMAIPSAVCRRRVPDIGKRARLYPLVLVAGITDLLRGCICVSGRLSRSRSIIIQYIWAANTTTSSFRFISVAQKHQMPI